MTTQNTRSQQEETYVEVECPAAQFYDVFDVTSPYVICIKVSGIYINTGYCRNRYFEVYIFETCLSLWWVHNADLSSPFFPAGQFPRPSWSMFWSRVIHDGVSTSAWLTLAWLRTLYRSSNRHLLDPFSIFPTAIRCLIDQHGHFDLCSIFGWHRLNLKTTPTRYILDCGSTESM